MIEFPGMIAPRAEVLPCERRPGWHVSVWFRIGGDGIMRCRSSSLLTAARAAYWGSAVADGCRGTRARSLVPQISVGRRAAAENSRRRAIRGAVLFHPMINSPSATRSSSASFRRSVSMERIALLHRLISAVAIVG